MIDTNILVSAVLKGREPRDCTISLNPNFFISNIYMNNCPIKVTHINS